MEAGARHIALVGRNNLHGTEVRDALSNAGPTRVDFFQADVRNSATACRIATQAREALGRIDVLINAAASNRLPALAHRIPIEEMPGIFSDIVLPPLLMSHAVLPMMRAQASGCILNIASDAAKTPTPGESVIGAAMAAIVMYTQTVAMEAKRDGVRVNVLTPSLIGGTGTAERLYADEFSARLLAGEVTIRRLVRRSRASDRVTPTGRATVRRGLPMRRSPTIFGIAILAQHGDR